MCIRDSIDRVLAHLDESGWARYRPGRFPGWMLTGHGRAEGERRLAVELEVTGTRARTEVLYRRFLVLNPEVLRVASAWQVRTINGVDVPNDHADEDHDAAVIAEMEACLLYTSPSPRDRTRYRMPSSA